MSKERAERALVRRMLEADDHLVVVGEAADGEAAIEQIVQLRSDVALIDVRMPGLDGVATMRRLRELGIDQSVILISTYAKDEYIFKGLAASRLFERGEARYPPDLPSANSRCYGRSPRAHRTSRSPPPSASACGR